MFRIRIPIVFLSCIFVAALSGSLEAEDSVTFSVELDNGVLTSNNGVLSLSWKSSGGSEATGPVFVLQQDSDESFSNPATRYQGSDTGSLLTGLAEGKYFFRVRVDEGPWSPTLQATVKFIDRRILITLLITGFVVAAATVGAILMGSASNRK